MVSTRLSWAAFCSVRRWAEAGFRLVARPVHLSCSWLRPEAKFGLNGLLLTVLLSGVMLTLVGLLRLGSLIKHIPHAVTVGFTCGIAVTILASQLKDLAGLRLTGAEPGPLIPKLAALSHALPSVNLTTLAVGSWVSGGDFGSQTLSHELAGHADCGAAIGATLAAVFHLPVDTIGSRFGGVPHGLLAPQLPPITLQRILQVFPAALSFTLLGGIESLLSAKVADGMTGRKHRSNMELVAQGAANVASALFGGISVTGTIARTATNIRAGARSPVSGILHAGFILLFMLVAAPLASFIPLAALAGVLVVVCWNMAEKAEFVRLLRHGKLATVLLTTFGLTLLKDLTFGIVAGCMMAALFAIAHRWMGAD